ncbi:MAG: isochorismatase [Oscillatoriales cyanobacterium]|nr:MAG: isochorismatase [Oscillatoriales cyanobacterium]
MHPELPIPAHFDPHRVGDVWRVPYGELAATAQAWLQQHQLPSVRDDRTVDHPTLALLIIDAQNTFCIPDFELFVAGRSGDGAVQDNRRLCEFIYRNLGSISTIIPTLDTHQAFQIFHPVFWVDEQGKHPAPMTMIDWESVRSGQWRINPAMPAIVDRLPQSQQLDLMAYGNHYTKVLQDLNKYPLTIWPFHSMLGGIGHALVSAVEAACFFHAMARQVPTRFEIKGYHPLTENYSVLRPEVLNDQHQQPIAEPNRSLIQSLLAFDAIAIAGQAKSHCVAWTISDLLSEIQTVNPALAQRVYLLEDCMSPVVVPGVVDFTEAAEAQFAAFAAAGMHRVRSTDALTSWPGWGLKTVH